MNREEFMRELMNNQLEDIKIVEKKNADYADGEDPFQNFRVVERIGLCSTELGIMVRLTDKLQRCANLLKREAEVKDESIADTLSDARNYLNILQVYLEKEKHDEQ